MAKKSGKKSAAAAAKVPMLLPTPAWPTARGAAEGMRLGYEDLATHGKETLSALPAAIAFATVQACGRIFGPVERSPGLSFARFMPALTAVAASSQRCAGLCCGGHSCDRPGKPFPRGARCQYHGAWRVHRSTSMSDPEKRNGEGPNTGVIVKAKPKTKKPSMYKVLMLNDDYTPMEFVVHILERFFAKTR